MKKIITILCVCSLLSSISTTVFAENVVTNSEKITDTKEIYDIVAPFIKENYADDVWIGYEEDGNERAVYIEISNVSIGVPEEYREQIADSISRYIEEKNIDSSMVFILFLDDVAVSNKIGDIDGNQTVDLSDLTKLSQYLLRDIELEDDQINRSDVNADDEVNLQDLALLKQFVMNDDVQLGLSS